MKALLGIGFALLWLSAAAPAEPNSLSSFASQPPPPAPDYAQPGAWAARPGINGPALLVPAGATPATRAPRVDVFYVHPTTFRSRSQWNQGLADAETNGWTDSSVIARQASAFNGCCRVFAPRYRQASIRAFSEMAGDGGRAYDFAYQDVLRAFDFYLAHDNSGRPFILAGHSQGGLHVVSLLRDRIARTPLTKRMVAAYVLGYGRSSGDLGTSLPGQRPCRTPVETGCVIGWNSFIDGSDVSGFIARSEKRFIAEHGNGPGKTLLCTNLRRFTPRVDRGLGALSAGEPLMLKPKAVAARCAGGVLMVRPDEALALEPLPGGNMHYHDVALFYGDLRADAIRRSNAFAKQTHKRR